MASTQTTIRPPAANKGAALLIYFNYMESQATYRLVQDQLRLARCMEGYKRIVLLKRDEVKSLLDFSEKDEKLADLILPPTKTNFFKQLVELARSGYFIDVRLFCHGWKTSFGGRNPVDPVEDSIDNVDVEKALAPSATGLSTMPIRSVWGTDCWGSYRNDMWVKLGAKVSSGSRGTNFYPNGFGNFADDWNKGNVSFERAVADADTASVRTVVQTFLSMVDAPKQKKDDRWGGCKFGQFVIGDSDCAEEYFSKCWGIGGIWQKGMSGKEMMNYSSHKLFAGDRQLTKNSVPKWA